MLTAAAGADAIFGRAWQRWRVRRQPDTFCRNLITRMSRLNPSWRSASLRASTLCVRITFVVADSGGGDTDLDRAAEELDLFVQGLGIASATSLWISTSASAAWVTQH